ncbi:MAG: hypothetical protein ACPHP7_04540 [Planctomycetota bacterium]
MPKGIILIVFAVSVFAGNVVQAQMPFDLDAELRLRWERRTPAAAEGDQTRGFSRLMLGYETELSDLIDMRLKVRDSRFFSEGTDTSEVHDDPRVHTLDFRIENVGQIHPYLSFMDGWDMEFGKSELPTYNKGRIIHSDDWSNLGPATSGGYHFHRGLLNDAIDFNFHHLTIDRDTFDANNEGEHAYGLHVDFNELPLIEASLFLWQFRADQSNAALAAENGNADPGASHEDTYGFAFTLRDGLIPDATLSVEYALQEGRRYNGDLDAIQRLDSLYYAIEGTYDLEPMERLWDMVLVGGHIFATGTSAGASRIEEFRSPFGTPHGTHGISDIIGTSNLKDTYVGIRTVLGETGVEFTYHELRADQGEDWGEEINLILDHRIGDLDVEFGAAKFNSLTSTYESTNFFYAQTFWNF